MINLRKLANRLGRRMYMYGRFESPNIPEKNGEYWLISQVLKTKKRELTFIDIGCNEGAWTDNVLLKCAQGEISPTIYSFEPCKSTREKLEDKFSQDPQVQIRKEAMSDRNGFATFYSSAPGAGTNSLHAISGEFSETVETKTLDTFISCEGIKNVHLIKIDAEGFDGDILNGARVSLEAGVFEFIQFEYNWRWILNGRSLKDVFNLIDGTTYKLGKLISNKVLIFDVWHYELDKFFEGNFVLVREPKLIEDWCVWCHFDKTNSVRF